MSPNPNLNGLAFSLHDLFWGYVLILQKTLAIGVLISNRRGSGHELWRGSRWVPLLGCHGCHCWVPLLGVPLLGAVAGCRCWVLLLGCRCWVPLLGCRCWVPLWGAIAGVPLREKIGQSVTPFSAAPFSTVLSGVYAVFSLEDSYPRDQVRER